MVIFVNLYFTWLISVFLDICSKNISVFLDIFGKNICVS